MSDFVEIQCCWLSSRKLLMWDAVIPIRRRVFTELELISVYSVVNKSANNMIQFQTPFIPYLRMTRLQSLRVACFYILTHEWLSCYLIAFLYTFNKYTCQFYLRTTHRCLLQLILNCFIITSECYAYNTDLSCGNPIQCFIHQNLVLRPVRD